MYNWEIRDTRAPLVELPSGRLHCPSRSPGPSFASVRTVGQSRPHIYFFAANVSDISGRTYHSDHADSCSVVTDNLRQQFQL